MRRYLLLILVAAILACCCQTQGLPKCETESCQICSQFGICVMCRPTHVLSINKDTLASECVEKPCKVQNCSRCLTDKICAQC